MTMKSGICMEKETTNLARGGVLYFKNLFMDTLSQINRLIKILKYYPELECLILKSLIAQNCVLKEKNFLLENESLELAKFFLINLSPKSKTLLSEPNFVGYKKITYLRKNINIFQIFALRQEDIFKKLESFLKKEKRLKGVIIFNPNNPTRKILKKIFLKQLITLYDNVYLIINETFIDLVEKESLMSEAKGFQSLFVFRFFTKFYGFAGAKVGYILTSNKLLEEVKKCLLAWNFNTFLFFIFKRFFQNEELKRDSLKYSAVLKVFFKRQLYNLGIFSLLSLTNFYLLIRILDSENFLFYLLSEKKFFVRICYNFHKLVSSNIRVSLKYFKNTKLFLEALKEW